MANFNPDNETIKIPFSNYKLTGLLLMSLGFVGVGIFFVIDPNEIANGSWHHEPASFIIAMGAIGIVLFGACCIYFIFKLLSPKPGLIVDINGIYDNSHLTSVGLIDWDDITDVTEGDQPGYINILVKNPEDYTSRLENSFIKRTAKAYFEKNGTPVSISQNGLKCDYNELYRLIINRVFEYKEAKKHTHFEGTL